MNTSWLTRILPESSLLDEKMYAAAKALDIEISKLFADSRQVLHLPRLNELEGLILDLLADQFHLDNYDAVNFSDAEKKTLIRQSIAWHRIKGTAGAVEMALQDAFRGLRLEEWFDYGGDPYYFRIYCRGYISTPERFGSYWRMLYDSKNVRSHLEKVTIDLTREEPIKFYTGIARINGGQTIIKLPHSRFTLLDLNVGIARIKRGHTLKGIPRNFPPRPLNLNVGIINVIRGQRIIQSRLLVDPDLSTLEPGKYLRLVFNFPTGHDKQIILKNPREGLTQKDVDAVARQMIADDIFRNDYAEPALGIKRAQIISNLPLE